MKSILFRKIHRTVWIALALLFCGALPSHADADFKKLASELSARIHAMKRARVTVVEFADLDSKPNKLGKFLAQRLQTALAEPENKLVVVDQNHIPQLFDQAQKLSEGLLDPATQQQLGKMTNTEVLIVGTVVASSMTVRVNVKAVDLQTAKMISGGNASLARMGIIATLAADAAGEGGAAAHSPEDSGKEPAAAPKPQRALRPARIIHDIGVAFELNDCSFSGGSLNCDLTVTSDRDRWIALHLTSQAWNQAGEEFYANEVSIANTISDQGCAKKQILKNVPTRLSLSFPQFEGESAMIERLRLAWTGRSDCYNQPRGVDFEKIALSENSSTTSPRRGGRSGESGSEGSSGSKGAGPLKRFGSSVLDRVLGAAENAIDKRACELSGDDEECEKDPPRP